MNYPFSNFLPYREKILFPNTDIVLLTPEHFYQAHKTPFKEEQKKVLTAPTPGKAKRLGRSVTLRSDWETIKFDIMIAAQLLKCIYEPDYHYLIMNTPNHEFVEYNNHHDNIWGTCLCEKCKTLPKQNLLQQVLINIKENHG